ncbi:hypothetical protein ACFYYB_33000 [Streptomyces sp. NPDC002886]|uniref:hypothetical protein n=1 Tax=Streptomyces sp. NPDC002886 TaxID=3364667 RepID=UPI0036AA31E3
MWLNAVAEALSCFERSFKRPGRYLDASEFESPGVGDARDALEWAMLHLPPGAKQDLGRLITRIDEEFERRTLPEPNENEWATTRWWWTKVRER